MRSPGQVGCGTGSAPLQIGKRGVRVGAVAGLVILALSAVFLDGLPHGFGNVGSRGCVSDAFGQTQQECESTYMPVEHLRTDLFLDLLLRIDEQRRMSQIGIAVGSFGTPTLIERRIGSHAAVLRAADEVLDIVFFAFPLAALLEDPGKVAFELQADSAETVVRLPLPDNLTAVEIYDSDRQLVLSVDLSSAGFGLPSISLPTYTIYQGNEESPRRPMPRRQVVDTCVLPPLTVCGTPRDEGPAPPPLPVVMNLEQWVRHVERSDPESVKDCDSRCRYAVPKGIDCTFKSIRFLDVFPAGTPGTQEAELINDALTGILAINPQFPITILESLTVLPYGCTQVEHDAGALVAACSLMFAGREVFDINPNLPVTCADQPREYPQAVVKHEMGHVYQCTNIGERYYYWLQPAWEKYAERPANPANPIEVDIFRYAHYLPYNPDGEHNLSQWTEQLACVQKKGACISSYSACENGFTTFGAEDFAEWFSRFYQGVGEFDVGKSGIKAISEQVNDNLPYQPPPGCNLKNPCPKPCGSPACESRCAQAKAQLMFANRAISHDQMMAFENLLNHSMCDILPHPAPSRLAPTPDPLSIASSASRRSHTETPYPEEAEYCSHPCPLYGDWVIEGNVEYEEGHTCLEPPEYDMNFRIGSQRYDQDVDDPFDDYVSNPLCWYVPYHGGWGTPTQPYCEPLCPFPIMKWRFWGEPIFGGAGSASACDDDREAYWTCGLPTRWGLSGMWAPMRDLQSWSLPEEWMYDLVSSQIQVDSYEGVLRGDPVRLRVAGHDFVHMARPTPEKPYPHCETPPEYQPGPCCRLDMTLTARRVGPSPDEIYPSNMCGMRPFPDHE